MLTPQTNTGLLLEARESDYELGALTHEPRNLTRDWRKFRSRPERQRYNLFDALDCVSQTSTNLLEAQANWMLQNNLWPEDAMKFWNKHQYIVNGKFEISERFAAKVSGTKRSGNTYQRVLDSFRNFGIVPEHIWPAQDDPSIDAFVWEKFYEEIHQDVLDLGKESLKYFNIAYEGIVGTQSQKKETMKKALEHAPLGIALATCSPWGARVPVCQAPANHAVTNDCFDKNFIIWDSYDPYEKILENGYVFDYVVKVVLYPVQRIQPVVNDPDVLLSDISYGESGESVRRLKRALHRIGWLPDINSISDFYGTELSSIVFKFQLANLSRSFATFWEMITSLKGRRCGIKTRTAINEALKR